MIGPVGLVGLGVAGLVGSVGSGVTGSVGLVIPGATSDDSVAVIVRGGLADPEKHK